MQHRRQRFLMDLLIVGGLVAAISGWAMGAGTPIGDSPTQVEMADRELTSVPTDQAGCPGPDSIQTNKPERNQVPPDEVARAPGPQAPSGAGEQTSTLRPRPASRRPHKVKLVTLDVYIGPGVEGSVTVSLKSVPVDSALAEILKMQKNAIDYKLVGYNTLIVAEHGKCDDILGKSLVPTTRSNSVRQEVLLEKAPAANVIGFLQGQYKNVEFIPHPTMNGFYAVGSREDILRIKKDIPDLDIAPVSFPLPGRPLTEVKCGDLNECKDLLKKLVPDVQIKPYQGGP